MSEDTTTEALLRFPTTCAHELDRECASGSCDACRQNIALATLRELQQLNELLRPFATMAQTRMGLVRGFTRGKGNGSE